MSPGCLSGGITILTLRGWVRVTRLLPGVSQNSGDEVLPLLRVSPAFAEKTLQRGYRPPHPSGRWRKEAVADSRVKQTRR